MPTNVSCAPLQLSTGVTGLDDVLGGGILESSCTVVVGGPGAGKTTLGLQFLFTNATSSDRTGLFFTGPAESPEKVLRHQAQFAFFESDRLGRAVHLVDLSQAVVFGAANRVPEMIAREAAQRKASFVVVDLVRALTPHSLWQDLAFYLAQADLTSLLIVDCEALDAPPNGVLSTADAVVWLRQSIDGDAVLRTVQVPKARGQQPLPGCHPMRLTWGGIQVFPRWPASEPRVSRPRPPERLSVGIQFVDQLLGGGVQIGDAVLAAGPSGSGKSVLATQFIAHNGHNGEPGLVVLFEERPDRYVERAEALGLGLERLIEDETVAVASFRGRDLSAEELLHELQQAIRRIRARNVVLDSLSGLELVLARGRGTADCLWRLLDTLTGEGVTVWLNTSSLELAPLFDTVVELNNRQVQVLKTPSAHDATAQSYEIGPRGLQPAQESELPKRRNGHTPAAPTGHVALAG